MQVTGQEKELSIYRVIGPSGGKRTWEFAHLESSLPGAMEIGFSWKCSQNCWRLNVSQLSIESSQESQKWGRLHHLESFSPQTPRDSQKIWVRTCKKLPLWGQGEITAIASQPGSIFLSLIKQEPLFVGRKAEGRGHPGVPVETWKKGRYHWKPVFT